MPTILLKKILMLIFEYNIPWDFALGNWIKLCKLNECSEEQQVLLGIKILNTRHNKAYNIVLPSRRFAFVFFKFVSLYYLIKSHYDFFLLGKQYYHFLNQNFQYIWFLFNFQQAHNMYVPTRSPGGNIHIFKLQIKLTLIFKVKKMRFLS